MVQFYSDPVLQEKHDAVFRNNLANPTAFPPGLNEREFRTVIVQLKDIVGIENLVVGADLVNFQDPYPLDEEAHQASAAVCPSSVEELQEILKVANQYSVPLWMTSRGKNLGYGGPAPRVTGSIVVSLHRMNRILEVNEQFAYVVVEPGVTFFDLDRYFKEKNLSLWCGVPALGWGSVVGNTLDRGHGYTVSGDRQHGIASMEVLLPSGEIMRTGQWGVSGSPSAHYCSNNFGPQVDGLFLQSNLGIVTKLGVYVDQAPQSYMSVVVHCPEVEDIGPLIDSLQRLFREHTLQNHIHIVNINHYVSRFAPKHEQQSLSGPLKLETIAQMKRQYKTGYWRATFDLYGTKELVLARFARVQTVLSENVSQIRIEEKFFEGQHGKPLVNTKVGTLPTGAPSMLAASLADYNLPKDGSGAGAHIDATLVLPAHGPTVTNWFRKMRGLMEAHGADPFIGCHVFDRHVLFVQEYVFDRTQASHRETGKRVLASILAAAKEARYPNYRSHLQHMDHIQSLFDFNGHIYKRFVEELKNTLDPNGVIAPGKQGIWPKKMVGKPPSQKI